MEKASNLTLRRGFGRLLRRFSLGLGLAIVVSPITAAARDRSSSPRRSSRANPPWSEPGRRIPPPRWLGSAEVPAASAHPAVHASRRAKVRPLFPRAGVRGDERDARRAAMATHPAGKGRADGDREVQVRPGDSLWSIAEDRVGTSRVTECWPKLYSANRSTIGDDPDHIEPGQTLTVPNECR
jgi:nucleoid-associated protein YgaU